MSMFFTRGVKTVMQQDTYIQRARMFGNRGNDVKHFELTIPQSIYRQWYSCFVLHRLSYQSAIKDLHPVWLQGAGTRAVAPNSIDRAHVRVDNGTMSFDKVKFKPELSEILNLRDTNSKEIHKDLLTKIYKVMGEEFLPTHVIDFVNTDTPNDNYAVAIHNDAFIDGYKDADHDAIYRARSFWS